MAKTLTSMSDKEFMEAWNKAGKEAAALKEQLRKFSKEHQRRTRMAALASRLGDLTDEDKKMIQSMEPTGVESQEGVGSN